MAFEGVREVGVDADRRLVWLLLRMAMDVKLAGDAVVSTHTLTGPQFFALQRLRTTGPQPMRDLAGELGCDASNLTGIADRLEARGLVHRQADPQDRRVKLLVLTEEGRRVADEGWQAAMAGNPVLALPEPIKAALLDALDPRRTV
jgi:DNA-binding MarR family transcriptional regulator